jgi:hypothetical protein
MSRIRGGRVPARTVVARRKAHKSAAPSAIVIVSSQGLVLPSQACSEWFIDLRRHEARTGPAVR